MEERPVHRGRAWASGGRMAALAAAAAGSGCAAALILTGHPVLAGLAALAAALGLVVGTPASDGVDRKATFLARVLDRAFDACLLGSLAWMSRDASVTVSLLALASLGASSVAAYEVAKGQSLRYAGGEGPGYRAFRMALLALGLLTGWVAAALWAVLVVTGTAAVVRAANVARQGGGPKEKVGASVA